MANSVWDALGSVNSLESAKKILADIKRSNNFKDANKRRANEAQLRSDLTKCRGTLELCKKDFQRVIRTQTDNIQKGQRAGFDTLVQEQILWDAALGYLLVRDAIYAIESVSSYDSVEAAYQLLDQATEQIKNKKRKQPFAFLSKGSARREEFGFLSSRSVQAEKEILLTSIFDRLKLTGDIDACIDEVNRPEYGRFSEENLGRRSTMDENMELLRSRASGQEKGIDVTATDSLYDISSSD